MNDNTGGGYNPDATTAERRPYDDVIDNAIKERDEWRERIVRGQDEPEEPTE